MASTDAQIWPTKGVAYRVTFDQRKNDGTLMTGGTNTTIVSKDAGTAVNTTNNPVEIATSSGVWYLDLTATEMNADTVMVKITNSGASALPQVLVIYTSSLTDPPNAPTLPTGAEQALMWLLALGRNKMTQTATTSTLRNDADSTNLSTSTVSDDGTTFTRGKWS